MFYFSNFSLNYKNGVESKKKSVIEITIEEINENNIVFLIPAMKTLSN